MTPAHRRAALLALTAEGERTVAETRRRLAARIAEPLSDWPPAEVRAFAHGLQRFVADGPFTRPEADG